MELVMDSLSKYFDGRAVVKDFSVKLGPGIHALLGPNGCGKTTLMRMVCDILEPTRGEVFFNTEPIQALDERYRQILGYLPQHFGYYPNFTAWDFLMYFAALKGLPVFSARERCEELLLMSGLRDFKDKKLRTFSGGMLQRVGIAQALLNDPLILILDEPTSGLDPKERIKLRNLISSLASERIVLFSTHIVADIEFISDSILIMKEGQLIRSGSLKELCREMKGKVWEGTLTEKEAFKLEHEVLISRRKPLDGCVMLRMLSDNIPTEKAVPVPPELEDYYLYHFQEN